MPAAFAVPYSAGSIDPPDALNVACFQVGKQTSLLPKLPPPPPNPPCETCLPRKAQVLLVSPALPGVFE